MSEMSGEQMQAKIAAARRDAEGLKDKIKRKKDELADTSCESIFSCLHRAQHFHMSPGLLGSFLRIMGGH